MNNKIDFLICWVDGSDPAWQSEKEKFSNKHELDGHECRYRDWDNLHYWFRGVEKFAPWVNNIYFVTWGHVPAWLNTAHPQLQIVRHEDFINAKHLPTFSVRPLEINLHNIKGLEEQFVYFNDDMFVIKPVKKTDFFVRGKPRDIAVMDIAIKGDIIHSCAVYNSIMVINKHFNKQKMIKENYANWFNPLYGKYLIKTILLSPWKIITGFYTPHLPNAFLKSTFSEVWEMESEQLEQTCARRFRSQMDLNQYLFRFWQLASGNFSPGPNIGRQFNMGSNPREAINALKKQKYKILCLNDSELVNNFNEIKQELITAFDRLFPDKSKFEL